MPYKDPEVRREKAKERSRLRYAKQKVRLLEIIKQHHLKYPEKRRAQVHRHYLKKREYYIRKYRERRARLLSATINPQSIEIFICGIRAKSSVKCYYCNKPTPGKTAHIDHIVPLSKGGAHSVENLCASCPKCNWSKNDTLIEDWFRLGQQILSL